MPTLPPSSIHSPLIVGLGVLSMYFYKLACGLLFCSLTLGLFNDSHAASISDVRVTYPSDFGQVLVGGARVVHNSIQWTGDTVADRLLITGNRSDFGVTGDILYASTDIKSGLDYNNLWIMESPQIVALNAAQSSSKGIGYFFAPYQAGLQTEKVTYTLNLPNVPAALRDTPVQGTGVADDVNNPALTLSISTQGGVEGANCEDMQNCKYVDVLPGGEVVFSVTPLSKKTEVSYAYVSVRTDEVGVDCTSGNFTFRDKGVTQVSFDPNDYYHVLDGRGPNGEMIFNCTGREVPALRSIGKSFQFKASNLRETKAGGYAQYRFYLNGHWDVNDTTNSKWPGSHKIYRLRTSKNIQQPPTPSVTANFTVNNNNTSSVTLTASASTSVAGASIASYTWTFSPALPDGRSTITTNSAILSLTQAGSYSVSLQATDSNGNKNATAVTNIVTVKDNTNPNASVTANFTVNNNNTSSVTLTASASTTLVGGSIASYTWTFSPALPDGRSTITTNSAILTLTQLGTYSVSLQATDSSGNKNATAVTNTVTVKSTSIPTGLTASFTATPLTGAAPLVVTLDASNSTGASSYTWQSSNQLSSTGVKSSMLFSSAGTYTITLTTSDGQSTVTNTQTVTVTPNVILGKATASFVVTPDLRNSLLLNLDASNSRSSTGTAGTITRYEWYVVDTSTGASVHLNKTEPVTAYTLPKEGYYTLSLVVTDDKDVSATVSETIVMPPLLASFTATPSAGGFPLNVQLDASASTSPRDSKIVSYKWFTNGVFTTIADGVKSAVQLVNPLNYVITLLVTDDKGRMDSASQLIKVVNPLAPIADFTATPATTANGEDFLTVNLNASASIDPDGGSVISYQWCCDAAGSKITTTDPKLSLKFTDNRGGDYKFNLIVSDNDGNGSGTGSNSTLVEKTITLNKPEAKFCAGLDAEIAKEYGQSITLDNSCSVAKPSATAASQIVNYNWLVRDFNDATRVVSTISSKLGNAAIPLNITPGDYQILVKAIDNYGIYGVNGTGRIAVTPPRIGNTAQGSSLSPRGVYQDSPAKFYAGVFANTGLVNSFNATDTVDLLAAITIDPKHRDQSVEILEVLFKNDDGSWYYKDARVNGFSRWDFQLSTLFAAEYAVKLDTATRHLKIWSGSFTQALRTASPIPTSAGKYTLYLGYRLNTGEIILNQAPFSFNVQ